jgi:hypothetical protein
MKDYKKYITDDIGAAHGLLHPSFFKKKAGSTGRIPQGAQSAKKGFGATGITTPIPIYYWNRGNRKTRVKSGFQLSTGLFSTLPAGRVGARLWLAGQQKPLKTVKNRTENPASEPEYGLTYDIGASRNAPYVQRVKMGNSGITTSLPQSCYGKGGGHWKQPSTFHYLSTGLISALPRNGKGRSWPISPSIVRGTGGGSL